ncbi:glycosyltransferase [Catellatospora sichuanensis]|uniref:glycosyltransferase n=1 Tax=Catellatospora sichuanensis TaxID=1969805 RepID=UPI001642CDFC|nr:glycosyltransferase [Catellatospora sichuanensis]
MNRSAARGSVVIPAHNEEAVLAACLDSLAGAFADGELEGVVVANGCTDATADLARSYPGVHVVELAEGSKPAALRAGERTVSALPRIYLDADVVLPLSSARTLVDRLTPGLGGDVALAARPPVRYRQQTSDGLVRRYYRARAQIPALQRSLWGAGVYAVSAEGRRRFTEFPDLVADDLWIDQLFAPEEIEIVECEPVTVTTPGDVSSLLRILRRTYRGKSEFHAAAPTARETAGDTARDIRKLAFGSTTGLVDAATYSGLVVTARLASRLAPRQRNGWERDASSRTDVR